jgi:hypothetical protein
MGLTTYTTNETDYSFSSVATKFFNDINNDVTVIYDKNNLNKQYSLTNISIYKKYKSINYILGVIILLCIIIVILTMLNKNMPYFDDNSYIVIVSIILALGIVYIIKLVFDTITRSNLNFDEYEFATTNNEAPVTITTSNRANYVMSDISLCNI